MISHHTSHRRKSRRLALSFAAAFGLLALVPLAAQVPSTRGGMGVTPYSNGTTFRVWAPGVDSVHVAGSWNNFSSTAHPMAYEGDEKWSVDIDGAVIGDRFKYVIRNNGGVHWRQDPYSLDVVSDSDDSIIADMGYNWQNGFSMPSWNELVIYEMHIGTYNDTTTWQNGNGTFDSAKDRLDHLQSLGINAVKLMPVMEFPGQTSYGYNPHSQFAPESDYGTPRDLKEFVDAAHGRGIAVIFDVVYNHLGNSPSESTIPLWCFTGDCLGNGGHYFYTDWKKETPWGWARPDYGRGQVREWLRNSAFVWLSEYRGDGLRWDSTSNIRAKTNGGGGYIHDGKTLMQWINNDIDAISGWKISIAEDLQGSSAITRDTNDNDGYGFDSQWDAGFAHAIRDAAKAPTDSGRNMDALRDVLYGRYNGDAYQRVIYTGSHDEDKEGYGHGRLPSLIDGGNSESFFAKKRGTLANAFMLTAPGIPMIFQGQEFLEDGQWGDRQPLDWDKRNRLSGINNMTRDLIRLRRNWYNNTRGLRGQNINVHHVNNSGKVIAHHRWQNGGNGDDVIVIANFSNNRYWNYEVGFPSGGEWKVRFNSDWNGYDSFFDNHPTGRVWPSWGSKDGMRHRGNVSIGRYSLVILSK